MVASTADRLLRQGCKQFRCVGQVGFCTGFMVGILGAACFSVVHGAHARLKPLLTRRPRAWVVPSRFWHSWNPGKFVARKPNFLTPHVHAYKDLVVFCPLIFPPCCFCGPGAWRPRRFAEGKREVWRRLRRVSRQAAARCSCKRGSGPPATLSWPSREVGSRKHAAKTRCAPATQMPFHDHTDTVFSAARRGAGTATWLCGWYFLSSEGCFRSTGPR